MERHRVVLRGGEEAILFKAESGEWACPVCGRVGLAEQPYSAEGWGTFEICSCGFEFGFDDDPGASAEALPSVTSNWERWRAKHVSRFRSRPKAFEVVRAQLLAIGVAVDP